MRWVQGVLPMVLAVVLMACGHAAWGEVDSSTKERSMATGAKTSPAAEAEARNGSRGSAGRSSLALHRFAQKGDIDGLVAEIRRGAPVNERDEFGMTALIYAVERGFVVIAEHLLKAEADPNIRAPSGATALFVAAAGGESQIVALLMKAGADITTKGPKGRVAAEAAGAAFGTLEEARARGEDPAVLALLAGRTLASVEAARVKRFKREWPAGKVFKDHDRAPSMIFIVDKGSKKGGGVAVSRSKITRSLHNQCVKDGACEAIPSLYDWAGSLGLKLNQVQPPDDDGDGALDLSWEAVEDYIRWLREITGKDYRAMTEKEYRARRAEENGVTGIMDLPFLQYGDDADRVWKGRMSALYLGGVRSWSWLDTLEGRLSLLRAYSEHLTKTIDALSTETRGYRVARKIAP